jgi:CBS domain-containing protein
MQINTVRTDIRLSAPVVPLHTPVIEALTAMLDTGTTAVIIADDSGLCGILTRGDVLRCLRSGKTQSVTVEQVMTSGPVTIGPDEIVCDAIETMKRHAIGHLPVMASDRLVGLLHITDVLMHQIDLQHEEIKHLQEYIQTLQNAEHD